jgi:hypothetical protein
MMGLCTGLIWLRIGTTKGSCEDGNEPSSSRNAGNLEQLNKCWLLKKDSASLSQLVLKVCESGLVLT